MALTSKQKTQLIDEVNNNGGKIGKAAGILDIDYVEAHDFMSTVSNTDKPTLSRPELTKYIISRRSVTGSWINPKRIDQARFEYDNGTIDMCQYREGNYLYLLAIPRQRRDTKRVRYFSRTLVE